MLRTGRSGTGQDGYRRMLAAGRRHPQRLWAAEGCQGIGRHLVQRLVVDGETVLDVPAKLSGRVYFDAKKTAGKTSMEAMRALKRPRESRPLT